MSLEKLLKLNLKKLAIFVVVFVVSIVAHNMLSALFGVEEALFFVVAVFLVPLYLLLAALYSFWHTLANIKDKNMSARLIGLSILTAYGVLVGSITDSRLIVMIADLISGFSVIGIAVLFMPFFKKVNSRFASAYLFLKSAEGLLMILGGLLFLLPPFAHTRDLIYEGVHLYVFIVGGYLFYYLLNKSRLVPRFIPVWGLVAISALLLTTVLKLMNVEYPNILDSLLVLIITNEIFLSLWLIFRGFKK